MIFDTYDVTVNPSIEPVTLAEAKAFLKVTTSDDDNIINILISAARRHGEKYCNRVFVNTTIECFFSNLDTSNCEPFPFIHVRRAPLFSISSVELYDAGSYNATTDYLVKNNSGFPRLIFENGATFETFGVTYPIKATIVFGYGTLTTDIPEDIRTAILCHVNFLYENRGDVIAEGSLSMPLESKMIYKSHYRILNTFG